MTSPNHNSEFDRYFASAEAFARPIAQHLRSLIHSTCPEVVEQIKWGIPHFDHAGEMMCIFAAYKKHCSFSFWKDSLMSDARLKANSTLPAAKRFMGKLTCVDDLPPDSDLVAWIKEAMSLNERGIKLPAKPSAKTKDVTVPPEFAERLASNPEVNAIFEGKSPSFKKEYFVWIGEAKTEATRNKRIEEAMAWIADGKGRFWKYS